jgi:hypothetical protein
LNKVVQWSAWHQSARRKCAFQIVDGVEVVVDELKGQLGGHFLQRFANSPLADAIMPSRVRSGTSCLKSPMRFWVMVSSPPTRKV